MSEIITQKGSEYNQASFIGGMNLLLDDTRLGTNQYRIGFDLTNRYDALDPVLTSVEDNAIPEGIIQECVTFGQYVIIFVSGLAYYRYYTDIIWTQISGFLMSPSATRYWSCAVPVGLTNYVRFANNSTVLMTGAGLGATYAPDAAGGIQQLDLEGSAEGNDPGLLVQDGVNQPQFIFLDDNGLPTTYTTQTFDQWAIGFTDATNTVVGPAGGVFDSDYDVREYVPIGTTMAWANGILFITSTDGISIYRSVSGRPLDFVVNVTNLLTTVQSNFEVNGEQLAAFWQFGGGDATTTSYGVGVGGISCIRPLTTGGIFVSASNANFAVTLNQTPNAPTIFGEYTFNRQFLFNATCLSDRVIFDSLGDTRFTELTGIRSFNATEQLTNQGRNSPFSSTIQGAFGPEESPLIQDATATASILYNNYELYSVNTIFGNVIAKYDTINTCWTSFDKQQTGGVGIKIFAKIELTVLRLYAVTTDNRLFTLYVGPNTTTPYFRTIGISSTILWAGTTVKMSHPKQDLRLQKTRVILTKITENSNCTFTPYFNNRMCKGGSVPKQISYENPATVSTDPLALPDVNTLMLNLLYTTPDIEQGWKYFGTFTWTDGSFIQFSMEMDELTPMNPEYSQGLTE
jgi:hypothetical protein